MFEDIFSSLSSFFPDLDFLGIPFLFWVIVIIILVVVVILAFVVFRPRSAKQSVYSTEKFTSRPFGPMQKDSSPSNSILNQNPQNTVSASDSLIGSSLEVTQTSSAQINQVSAVQAKSSSPTIDAPLTSTSSANVPKAPAQSSSSKAAAQQSIIVSKTDSSLKQLLIAKFQSKIEGQLGDKVVIKDVSSQGVNFLVTIDISEVQMILTLDPAGKIIDYKKINSSAK